MVVFAPKPDAAITRRYAALDGWRITFDHILAFRHRPIPDWAGALPMPKPLDMNIGAWEVSSSSWLKEVTPPNWAYPARHFAITFNEDVYENAASDWNSQPLMEGWDLAYGLRPN
jgi:hypothetical protein